MQQDVIIAGFGGQGLLFAGQTLAQAAMLEDKQVTWFPSYGPEMRGGTANCTVIVSDEEIGSPIVQNPASAIIMNIPSMEKYEPLMRKDGLLIVNSSIVESAPRRNDVKYLPVKANDMALELGNEKLASVIMLGAYCASTEVVSTDSLKTALEEILAPKRVHLLEPNIHALQAGWQAALAVRSSRSNFARS